MVLTNASMNGPEETATLRAGDIVKVSPEAVANGRPFDFGEVRTVNEDGTFAIVWGNAGCFCQGVPNEKASDLVKTTTEDWDAYMNGTGEYSHLAKIADPDDEEESQYDWEDDDDDDDDDMFAEREEARTDAPSTVNTSVFATF